MLTPEQMEALQDALELIAEPITTFIVKDVIRRISEAGQITSTAEYQIAQAKWLMRSEQELNKLMAREDPDAEIKKLFEEAVKKLYEQEPIELPFEDDAALVNIVQSSINMAAEEFKNITQTLGMVDPYGNVMPLHEAYTSAADYAFLKTMTGAQSYQEACYEAAKNLIDKGVRVIDYESGVHTAVDAAIRRDVFGGMGLMVEKIEAEIHTKTDATGWEISAHEASAPDHEPYQGRQYTNEEYMRLNGTEAVPGILKRRISTLNCKHIAFPIIYGVTKPIYSEEELKAMAERNRNGVNYEGKHYSQYEATQTQRKLERAIRNERRKIVAYEGLPGQDAKLNAARARYTVLMDRYAGFSKAAGLKTQDARLLTYGFGPKQEKAARQLLS